jgi:hypothetical protein
MQIIHHNQHTHRICLNEMQIVRWEKFCHSCFTVDCQVRYTWCTELSCRKQFYLLHNPMCPLVCFKVITASRQTVLPNSDSNKHGYVKQYICCEVWNSDRWDAVSCGRNVPTFQTNLLSPSSAWKNSNIFFYPEDTSRAFLWNAWKFLLDYMLSQCSVWICCLHTECKFVRK